MSRSNSLSTKKFSMYTGLSPKEKIEYRDYNDFRYVGLKKVKKDNEEGRKPMFSSFHIVARLSK